jgi:leucyl aminopeptidase
MRIEQFWKYINKINGNAKKFKKVVPPKDRKAFKNIFNVLADVLHYRIVEQTNMYRDGYEYHAWWAVGKGEDTYIKLLNTKYKGTGEEYCSIKGNEELGMTLLED